MVLVMVPGEFKGLKKDLFKESMNWVEGNSSKEVDNY